MYRPPLSLVPPLLSTSSPFYHLLLTLSCPLTHSVCRLATHYNFTRAYNILKSTNQPSCVQRQPALRFEQCGVFLRRLVLTHYI